MSHLSPPPVFLVKCDQIVLKLLLRSYSFRARRTLGFPLPFVMSLHTPPPAYLPGFVLSLMHTLYCFTYRKLFYLPVPYHTLFPVSFSLLPATSLHFCALSFGVLPGSGTTSSIFKALCGHFSPYYSQLSLNACDLYFIYVSCTHFMCVLPTLGEGLQGRH